MSAYCADSATDNRAMAPGLSAQVQVRELQGQDARRRPRELRPARGLRSGVLIADGRGL